MPGSESNVNSNPTANNASEASSNGNNEEQRRVLGIKDAQDFNEDLIKSIYGYSFNLVKLNNYVC